MRKTGEFLAVLAFILATAGVIFGVFYYEHLKSDARNAIDLEARAVSTWSKKEITVHAGKPARIRIRNADNVSHGFAIPELDVPEYIIPAGQTQMVEFTPKFAGKFVFKCVVQCSPDRHDYMTGTLVVLEK